MKSLKKGCRALIVALMISVFCNFIAFGDEVNDIEMLTLVGLGIAMENADDVVKEAADQIAGSNDQDGVGKELEKIFGNAGK